MIIFPKLSDYQLQLTAYSTVVSEFLAFERVLKAAVPERIYFDHIEKDRIGREGRRAIVPQKSIPDLETYLNAQFVDYEGETVVLLAAGSGRRFCCREVTSTGTGSGREEIDATDADAALFKCGLVARRNRWATGVARSGRCLDLFGISR